MAGAHGREHLESHLANAESWNRSPVVSDEAQPIASGSQAECQHCLKSVTTFVSKVCTSASGGNARGNERSEQDSDTFKMNLNSACEPSMRDGGGFRMRCGEPVTLGAIVRNNSFALSEAGTVEDSDGDRGHSWSPVRCKEDEGDLATESASTRLKRLCKLQSSLSLKSQESPSSTAGTTHADHLSFPSPRLDGPAQGSRSIVPPAMRNLSRDASAESNVPCARGTCLVLGSCICGQRGKFKPL